jgi:hypothetical protein
MMLLPCDREALLAEAHARVTGRRTVRSTLDQAGAAAEELQACVDAGWRCVSTLARPAAAVLPLDASRLDGELHRWHAGLERRSPGTEPFAYLVTCGYDSRDAFRQLDGDYAGYHFQDAFARELVFALGRLVGRQLRAAWPTWRFTREVIGGAGPQAACGASASAGWEPRMVAALLRPLGGALGVAAASSGALVPLHSLLGVMTGVPCRQAGSAIASSKHFNQ